MSKTLEQREAECISEINQVLIKHGFELQTTSTTSLVEKKYEEEKTETGSVEADSNDTSATTE